jgi:hypothetical protein
MRPHTPTGGDTGPVHRRYELCTRLGIAFATVETEHCHSREDAIAWIAANQLGRRNLTPSQRAAFSPEWERQLAAEAKKRLRLSNTSQARLPDSEKGQARDKAAEYGRRQSALCL